MERVIVESLGDHSIQAGLIDGLTGVWVLGDHLSSDPATADAGASERQDQLFEARASESGARRGSDSRKIGSIGVHVNRGITTHGFAINVNNDLQPFEWIVPCGIEACRMTSLTRELGAPQDMGAFMDTVSGRFGEIYGRRPVPVEAAELASRVDGVEALVAAGPAAAHARGNGVGAAVR
jgi:lipoate-protein ligase B